jgi:hypothetical protein
MKKVMYAVCFLTLSICVMYSCKSYGITYENGKVWEERRIEKPRKYLGNIQRGKVEVDKSGGSSSIEREIDHILPLVFGEEGFLFHEPCDKNNYVVDVYATERDINDGWNVKKSISMEVSLRPLKLQDDGDVSTPHVAARTVVMADTGLSISGNIEKYLRATIKKAARSIRTEIKTQAKIKI